MPEAPPLLVPLVLAALAQVLLGPEVQVPVHLVLVVLAQGLLEALKLAQLVPRLPAAFPLAAQAVLEVPALHLTLKPVLPVSVQVRAQRLHHLIPFQHPAVLMVLAAIQQVLQASLQALQVVPGSAAVLPSAPAVLHGYLLYSSPVQPQLNSQSSPWSPRAHSRSPRPLLSKAAPVPQVHPLLQAVREHQVVPVPLHVYLQSP